MIPDSNPKVSILTLHHPQRRQCLPIVGNHIEAQTYPSIIEWVIIVDALDDLDSFVLRNNDIKVRIVQCPSDQKPTMGALRNFGNDQCCGDIIVVMDDDDFQFPTRVAHSVATLQATSHQLVGCSRVVMYDVSTNQAFHTLTPVRPYHSIFSCMAWKKTFTGRCQQTDTFSEEQSFTSSFQEPLVQLDPLQTIICLRHPQNILNTRELMLRCFLGQEPIMRMIQDPITEWIPSSCLDQWKKALLFPQPSPFEYVIYTGGPFPKEFRLPADEKQDLDDFAIALTSLGKTVAVYGWYEDHEDKGVVYKAWQDFPLEWEYSHLILWGGTLAIVSSYAFGVNVSGRTWIQVRESMTPFFANVLESMIVQHPIRVLLKSTIHLEDFLKHVNAERLSTICDWKILPSGYNQHHVQDVLSYDRIPYSFLCSASPHMVHIVDHLWPEIIKVEPSATLYVISNEWLENASQPFHPSVQVVTNSFSSSIRYDFCLCFLEVPSRVESPASLRWLSASGCIPIFPEALTAILTGFSVSVRMHDTKSMTAAGRTIGEWIHDVDAREQLRERVQHSVLPWTTLVSEFIV